MVASETPGSREACQLSGSGGDKDELEIGGNFLSIEFDGGDCGDSNYGIYGGVCLRGVICDECLRGVICDEGCSLILLNAGAFLSPLLDVE